jgi:hypothetical protein
VPGSRAVAMTRLPRRANSAAVARPMPLDAPVISTDAMTTSWVHDPYAAVRVDVGIARQALPAGLLVSGLVYDMDTGLVQVVVPPTTG